ncbi:ABC-type antimicrobial peptide transport system, permease component [Chitinophaga sp. YR573]|uniref:ABC transporter permease n=1 Tax=Chitinophaga sp. YR573 TaxID=1881040 RepID=UPI0008B35AD3|nr:ABC transporter permease [Chitinophaga sp. YR573]SEW36063.1 ABC-type antimicrobial peptide transport system, permease component [Chitinophaga sp. YR573]
MLKSYFKIAWRNLLKDRQFTFLNLVGLSTGLACTLLIYLWVMDELNVDKFHENDARLFQVLVNSENAGAIGTGSQTPGLLAQTLAKEMPGVRYAVATAPTIGLKKTTLSVGENVTKAVGQYADKDYFNMFSWHLIQGRNTTVLADKNSIVLSKDLAMKLFNRTDNVIGKTVVWQQDKPYTVSGIFEGTPANSSVQFDYILPYEAFLDARPYEKDWGNADPYTYLMLDKDVDWQRFSRNIAGFLKTKDPKTTNTLFLRPFSTGYLYNQYENGVQSGGRIEYVRLFSLIAAFILIIACINFMNLATAKAAGRMKEVGIKKVVGAGRGALILQYLGESMLMCFLSLTVALVLVIFLIPPFNIITGKQLALHFDIRLILSILGVGIFTGLIAGSYPAFYLSGFAPVAILKGKLKNSAGENWLRKALVVFQFTLSVVFIIAVIVVYRQIVFIQTKSQGFNKDNVISFDIEGKFSTPAEVSAFLSSVQNFLREVKNVPGVINASSMDHESIIGDYGTFGLNWEGKDPKNNISFGNIGINYGMIETLGMQMAAGRSFSSALSSDSAEIIFNQAAIDRMGLKNPIGKKIRIWDKDRTIVGIIKNFHVESLHENVMPFVLRLEPLETYCILARIKTGEETKVIEQIRTLYQKFNPGYVFDYKFLDQDYQAQYVAEKRVAVLSRWFAGLTILISCLGLFGLAAFTARKRQKEIGIRKIVGATISNVLMMLTMDFLKLVGIAVLVAFPLAWWATDRWLQSFAYHVSVGADIYLIAGSSIIFITLCTISFQGIKAAIANPVQSLKTE